LQFLLISFSAPNFSSTNSTIIWRVITEAAKSPLSVVPGNADFKAEGK
jgi:hypothetical protein